MIDCPSPNHDDRAGTPISMIVLHYTGMESADAALQRLTDAEAKVSAHYLVDEDGTIKRLVDESRRAWHAGRSYWRGITNVNAASIGIEIVNPGHEWGYKPFAGPQMGAVLRLTAEITQRYAIKPAMVVGHSDVAPARKQDPGELFEWELLARNGLAYGPVKPIADPLWTDGGTLLALNRFGYDVTDGPAAVRAFQRHFRPSRIDGIIDGETRAILLTLLINEESESKAASA